MCSVIWPPRKDNKLAISELASGLDFWAKLARGLNFWAKAFLLVGSIYCLRVLREVGEGEDQEQVLDCKEKGGQDDKGGESNGDEGGENVVIV